MGLYSCGLDATVFIVFIVDSLNRVWHGVDQTIKPIEKKIWLLDPISSDRVAVMVVVASRHAIQDQLCLALLCGLDCVRAIQGQLSLEGHIPQIKTLALIGNRGRKPVSHMSKQ